MICEVTCDELVIRNEDIEQVIIGKPKGHKHLRMCLKLKDKTLILQEATIANISRAYITIKTHPTVTALKLERKILSSDRTKEGYTRHQLLEVQKNEKEVEEEISRLLEVTRLF